MKKYDLSIVVPTVNRAPLLKVTLSLVAKHIQQVAQYSVELIVCDNASDDDTTEAVKALAKDFPFIQYQHFEDRVSIDESFKRSVATSHCEYVWILGDDDFPLTGAITRLIEVIKKYQDCRFFHFERLTADPKIRRGTFNFVVDDFSDELLSGRELIKRVFFRPGFISSFAAHRSLWEGDFDFKPFVGYGFLAWIYSRIFEEKILLMGEPLCIQRNSNAIWKSEWPRYLLLSQPRIFHSLPFEEGELKSTIYSWRQAYSRPRQFFYNAMLARTSSCLSKEEWSEVLSYQGAVNKILGRFSNLIPKFICKATISRYLAKKHS
jgi:glycosyltransferase involved in cell wall biosynthesis